MNEPIHSGPPPFQNLHSDLSYNDISELWVNPFQGNYNNYATIDLSNNPLYSMSISVLSYFASVATSVHVTV